MPVLCPALRCHPGVTLSCVVWVPVLQDTTETNPREQKRRGIKFHIPREAPAQSRRMLGRRKLSQARVCPTLPSLDTPLLPLWGGNKDTWLWHGEPRLQAERRRKANKETPSSLPPSPKSRGKASGKGSHAGREGCPAGQLKLAGLEAAAAATRLPALPPVPSPGDKGPSCLRGQAQPPQDGPSALGTTTP